MSIFRNDSLSNLLSRTFVFNKDENGVVYVQDNGGFIINKEEAKQLIDGLNKFIKNVDEVEINDHNDKIGKKRFGR